MRKKDTRTKAFPSNTWQDNECTVFHGSEGMNLRDYFAASALTAILQNKDYYNRKACKHAIELGELDSWNECNTYTDADSLSHSAEICATAAYNIADAMMRARKEGA